MNKTYDSVLAAIIDATINHHATIVVEPAYGGYEFIVHLLGRGIIIDTSDPQLANDVVCQFIDDVLTEVDG